MSRQHLLIAGGGTGGHIAPAIAVGERASDIFRVSYACTPRPVDSMMYSSVTNEVHVMNPPRIDKGMKLLLPFTALKAFCDARSLLKSIKADIVLGTGGYSSFFAVIAARSLGIPAAVFDSNALPGKSNRLASRFCKIVFTGFQEGEEGLKCNAIHTGTPVSEHLKKTDRQSARKQIGIPENLPVILFLGGSQGARAINDLALGIQGDVSVLLQSGKRDYARALKNSESANTSIIVKPFVDLAMWYSAADLAVARAGGQTIAELAAFGLPAVFIPYPYAAEDHQTANALAIVKTGGALLQVQNEAEDSSSFSSQLMQLLGDSKELEGMSRAIASIFPSDPAGRIVSNLRELLQ